MPDNWEIEIFGDITACDGFGDFGILEDHVPELAENILKLLPALINSHRHASSLFHGLKRIVRDPECLLDVSVGMGRADKVIVIGQEISAPFYTTSDPVEMKRQVIVVGDSQVRHRIRS